MITQLGLGRKEAGAAGAASAWEGLGSEVKVAGAVAAEGCAGACVFLSWGELARGPGLARAGEGRSRPPRKMSTLMV